MPRPTTLTSVTSATNTGSCAAVLRDASRRLTHDLNNAANGVAVNLEVVRSRTTGADSPHPAGAFAERASQQLEALTTLQEIVRSLLQLTISSLDDGKLSCALSADQDAFEVTFAGAAIPRGLRADQGGGAPISMRNSPQGVILSVPRTSPSSE
jgi:hypothetical protein